MNGFNNTKFVILILLIIVPAIADDLPEEETIIMSERIGEVMDAREREYYHFMPAVKDFIQARFLKLNNYTYIVEVTYIKDCIETKMRITQSSEQIEKLKNAIMNIELNYHEEIEKIETTKKHELHKFKPQPKALLYSEKGSFMSWVNFGIGFGTLSPNLMGTFSFQYDEILMSLQTVFGVGEIFWGYHKTTCGILGGACTKRPGSLGYASLAGGPTFSWVDYSPGWYDPREPWETSGIGLMLEVNLYAKYKLIGIGITGYVDVNSTLTSTGVCLCLEIGS